MKLLSNIRFYVLFFSVSLSLAIFFLVKSSIPEGGLQIIRLTQIYALTAVTYLYLAVLVTPLIRTFPVIPLKVHILKARRAIGVSTFYFAGLHASLAFFGQLGGFTGLIFLPSKYLLAIILSFTALIILSLMAATSFDYMVTKLTFPKWKMLHRFVYLAGILILIHALMLGTHFQDLFGLIPQILFIALGILFLLEANRFDNFLQNKFVNLPRFGFTLILVVIFLTIYFMYSLFPISSNGTLSLGVHAYHIQLAKEAQKGLTNSSINLPNIPSLQGDRTKRFTVSFNDPQNISPNQDVTLSFKVFDASSGNQIQLFQRVYEKVLHLIVVDSELKFFNHIHPDLTDQGFEITTQFPHPGRYHLYLNFQPLGAIEQQLAFTVDVGNVTNPALSSFPIDQNLTKVFGNYEVTLNYPSPLKAADLSIGSQKLTFNIKDAKTKESITNLKPYLAAFGHLVMINTGTYDYLHVHPNNLVTPKATDLGGPIIEFLPLGLYGPIKPGIYRVFAQFNPNGNLMVTDFTIKIE